MWCLGDTRGRSRLLESSRALGPQLDTGSRKHSLRIVRDKAGAAEASGNVFQCHTSHVSCAKCQEKFDLGDVIDVRSDESINFFAVSPFERTEDANVKRLGHVRGMRRKADKDNVVVSAVRSRLDRLMAPVSVEH